ncbi:hypothetical protein BDZ89DRAFT_1057921 [Hymenopellis radicata]|nr:hypothetical protein BDZ89DRAFT_1057921 [Hymenopellis radicata]
MQLLPLESYLSLLDVTLPPIDLDARLPLSRYTILNLLLPSLFCITVCACFRVWDVPRLLRVAFLPFALRRMYSTAVNMDFTRWYFPELGHVSYAPKNAAFNQALLIGLTIAACRSISWTFASASSASSSVIAELTTLRGPAVPKPREWRPTASRRRFVAVTLLSALLHMLLFDLVHMHIHAIRPALFRDPRGGVFLAGRWPTPTSMYLSGCAFALTFLTLQYTYDVLTALGVALLAHTPEHFYLSTSLTAFWGRRWHQLFRQTFVSVCGAPVFAAAEKLGCSKAQAKLASLISVFGLSAVVHWLGIWAMGHGASWWHTGGFFMANCVGIIMESIWSNLVGRHTGRLWYVAGWTWTFVWLLWWGSWMVDEWVRKAFVFDRLLFREPDMTY